jgi:choice-of-anchor B domain-containing protein
MEEMYQQMCTDSNSTPTSSTKNPCMCGFLESLKPVKQDLTSISGESISCVEGFASTNDDKYPCSNVDLLSLVSLTELNSVHGEPDHRANDIWGWTAPTGEEIAIVGLYSGTAFVDITDPVNYKYLGKLPTKTVNSSWRDIKTHGNYAFIVSEAADHGMQVSLNLRTVSCQSSKSLTRSLILTLTTRLSISLKWSV